MAIVIPDFPSTPISLDREVRQYLESLSERKYGAPGRITDIDAVSVDEYQLLVFGKFDIIFTPTVYYTISLNRDNRMEDITTFYDPSAFITQTAMFLTLGLYAVMPSVWKRVKQKQAYDKNVASCRAQNMEDATKKVSGIRVFQGSASDLERELGRPVERVDMRTAETFLRAEDTFHLRVQAYRLGADAIVHYVPGSSIGTPVRFVDKSALRG